ncbi:MAG TPA: diguanylate cyclase [Candidatus Dormibacteraeota bacterium]
MAEVPVSVRPSAACELFWALERIERSHKRIRQPRLDLPEPIPADVQRRIAEFWSDGLSGFMEVLVLADWAGVLYGEDVEPLLEVLASQARLGGAQPAFASELPEERSQLNARLRRLKRESGLRKRYVAMASEAWTYFAPAWAERGRPAVENACAEWSRLLSNHTVKDALPEYHVVYTMGLDALVGSAVAERRAVLSPGFFFGSSHVFDLASTLSIGVGLERHPLDHRYRISGHIVAGQLAVLGDPDRATVLAALADGNPTEKDLAKVCGMTPAAVRRHLNVLRRADLIVGEGARPVRYRMIADGIERLFSDSSARLLGSVREAGLNYWERLAAAADYHAVFDTAPVGILQLDLEGNCLTCNPAAERLFGATRSELAQLSSQRLVADTGSADPFAAGATREVRLRRIGPQEPASFWASVSVADVADAEGRPQFRYAMIEDLSERRRAEDALRESEQRFRTVFRRAAVGIARLSLDGRIIEANPALAEMMASTEGALAGHFLGSQLDIAEFAPGALRRAWEEGLDEIQCEGALRAESGRELWISAFVTLARDESGSPAFAIALLQDSSGRKAQEQMLTHRAMHDPLTDLPNRLLFHDRLDQALRSARRGGEGLAVMLLDLDGFKEVNDTHGHHVGDLLLIEVAGRLQSSVRLSDTVARLGGDEFAVLLPEVGDEKGVTTASTHVLERLREPLQIGGATCSVGASIGVALYPHHGGDAETLMAGADAAMYAAKRAGHGFALACSPTSEIDTAPI